MKNHIVKVLRVGFLTHDTKNFIVEKPKDFEFLCGQATSVGIKKEKELEQRPFTFASINSEKILEFIIKKYPEGETEKIHRINPGEELVIADPFGSINYKGEGYFIAGGAGVTPFISILRELHKEGRVGKNKLLFSNKRAEDIILEKELKHILGNNLILNLTEEKKEGIHHGRIDKDYLKKHIKNLNEKFYVCGPPNFVTEMKKYLIDLGVDEENIVVEGG